MKYKEGDKVRIVKERTKRMNRNGEMDKYLDTIMTIEFTNPYTSKYIMKEDNARWNWYDNMIVGLAVDRELNNNYRYGELVDHNHSDSVIKRFWENVDVKEKDDCWNWKASLAVRGGYGQLMTYVDGKRILQKAHRLSYEINNGSIYQGEFICHKCNNPKCCNPNHLYAGSPSDNWQDTIDSGKAYQLPPIPPEDVHCAKLDFEKAREIRESDKSTKYFMNKYNVSKSTICRVRRNEIWIEE